MPEPDSTGSDDSDLEDTSFSLQLFETGGFQGGYHVANDPANPYQRETVTHQRGTVGIRCKSREIVHGILSPDDDTFATFLVYDFHFDTFKSFRRITEAIVTFEFRDSEPKAPSPEVVRMEPLGKCSLEPTTHETSRTRENTAGANVSKFGVGLGASTLSSKTVSGSAKSQARVVGSPLCSNYGKETGASWSLFENAEGRDGVPSFLRTAILLKRQRRSKFECTFKVKVRGDWRSTMKTYCAIKPIDDPILFDPELPPTNNLRNEYDTGNLDALDLKDFFDITVDTVCEGSVRTRAL